MKNLTLVSAITYLLCAGSLSAQVSGALQFTQDAPGASFTSSSFVLPDELVLANAFSVPASPSGIFTGYAGDVITVTDPDSTAFLPGGVSSNPSSPSSVNNIEFLTFGSGTQDKYAFYLDSIYMTNSNPSNPGSGTASVLGTGTLVDLTNTAMGQYAASFSVSDVLPGGPVGGTLTAEEIESSTPEPPVWGYLFCGLAMLIWRFLSVRV